MASLRVIEPGMLTTVQDLGRGGCSALGIARGGAADSLSHRIANLLVGNQPGAPALEMTLTGGTFECNSPGTIALTGGTVIASIESSSASQTVATWTPHQVRPGDRIRIGPITRGVRTYLAFAGGIDVPLVLRSAATHLGAAFGGFHGRALRAGDTLPLGEARLIVQPEHALASAALSHLRATLDQRTLRATDGPHASAFPPDQSGLFWDQPFTISPQSNRVGIRLSGPAITPTIRGNLTSEGMMHGAVQAPENGQPIILGVDHPTTGGYPVIACIAAADLPILGQLRPGEQVRFQRISHEQALALYLQREALLAPPPASP